MLNCELVVKSIIKDNSMEKAELAYIQSTPS